MRIPLKLAIVLLSAAVLRAEEIPVKSGIVSLGLFKNGLAVVRKTVSIAGPGTYRVDDVPEPVHGTFWIESVAGVEARMTSVVEDVPADPGADTDLQEELAGSEVRVHFRDGGIPPAEGKVVGASDTENKSARDRMPRDARNNSFGIAIQPASPGRFLVLDGPGGRTYIDTSMIAYLQSKGGRGTVKKRRPALLLTVPATAGKPPAEIFISYLARGISWAPGYRLDITDPGALLLDQNAVVKNEFDGFDDAEVSLISGFPSMLFANVTSPFSLNTNWALFFQQLNQRFNPGNPAALSGVSMQAITINAPIQTGGFDLSAVPSGEGVDLHYQSIGRRALSKGDSLAVHTGSGRAAYKRIVEWIVPDTRDANGHSIDEYRRQQEPDKYRDAAWDAIRFRNPLPFPMTSAPVMIIADGRFNGQQMTGWVNAGEETTLHITKALSLRTWHSEQEEPGSREIVYVGGNDYRRVGVRGDLKVNNHRNETVSVVIRRSFSGDLTSAEESPSCNLREEGVYSVNKRNELVWTFDLKPGEEKALSYRYSVLVDN